MGDPDPDPLVGRLLDGRYRVRARLARGGMATVYEALDLRLDRPVALKVMHPELAVDASFVARFIAEARSAARLGHPGVVAVYDQGEDTGTVYLAMERVEGRTLRQVLRERGRLDAGTALDALEQVLAALAAAHRAGIVHRDVKPENVLVDAAEGRVKVADFGLARAVGDEPSTTRGVLLGTVAYLSPEQGRGEPATPRSDVYSAGIVLYELLTGQPPHAGETDIAVVRAHVEQDVPAPSLAAPWLPRAVDLLVERATARDPARRFADAGDFLTEVRRTQRLLDSGAADADGDADTVRLEPWEAAGVSAAEALGAGPDGGQATHRTTVLDALAPAGAGTADPAGGDGARTGRSPVGPSPGGQPAPDEAPTPPGRRRHRGRRVALLVVLLAVAAGTAAWWFGMGRWTATPSLLELTVVEAEEKAAAAGLTLERAGEEFSETVEPDRVTSTDPGPGERVLHGGTVAITVSKGPERYEVPDVRGDTLDEARSALTDRSLVTGAVVEAYDEEVEQGRVVSQSVEPGAQARRDTAVDLVVSKGREPRAVPDTTGQPVADATTALEAAGLAVTVTEAFSDTVPAGTVISQEPAGGSLFRGDPVALVVSKGPELVELPRVEGQPADDAQRALEAAGFAVRRLVLLPAGPGTVLRQDPSEGERLPRGTEITLYVF